MEMPMHLLDGKVLPPGDDLGVFIQVGIALFDDAHGNVHRPHRVRLGDRVLAAEIDARYEDKQHGGDSQIPPPPAAAEDAGFRVGQGRRLQSQRQKRHS
jgi:hypothetical protein